MTYQTWEVVGSPAGLDALSGPMSVIALAPWIDTSEGCVLKDRYLRFS